MATPTRTLGVAHAALVAPLLLLGIPARTLAQDPVKVDPAHHRVEVDNADVRILRITFGPGEKAPLHDHPNAVAVFLTDSVNRLTPQGGKPNETARKRGDVALVAAVTHTVENGQTPSEVVLVELKKPGSAAYKGMSLDPAKLAPTRYVVVAENEHVRVMRLRFAVGDMGVEHEHPSHVIVSLAQGPNPPGTVRWVDGPQRHGDATPSKTGNDVILVELKSGTGAKAKP